MARSERYFVGPSLLRDIRRTIAAVGGMPYTTRGFSTDAVLQTLPTPSGSPLRLCKTSALFAKNTIATLDVWEDGTPPDEEQTPNARLEGVINKYADIPECTFVSVAKHANGRYYVVAAEC